MQIRLNNIYFIQKEGLVMGLLNYALLIAFLGSMNVWFMIPISAIYPIFSCILMGTAFFIRHSYKKYHLTKNTFFFPIIAFLVLNYYIVIVNHQNLNACIKVFLNSFVLCGLCMYDKEKLADLSTWLAKLLGGLLLVSYPFFLLYLMGVPLPNVDMQFNDNFYSFSNYFLYLIARVSKDSWVELFTEEDVIRF